MNTQEKSLNIMRLMRWENQPICVPNVWVGGEWLSLDPYANSVEGLAQFSAILLKYFSPLHFRLCKIGMGYSDTEQWMDTQTQENILDEILRMNGVEI